MTNENSALSIASLRSANNFDLIRLVAASLVVFSHSFILTEGTDTHEFLYRLTAGREDLGQLAVATFFVISGFLITMSYESSRSVGNYLWKRLLRVFPALLILLLLTTFVLGPIASSLSLKEYFSQSHTYTYLTNVRLFRLQYDLPGLFHDNPYPNAVNGSLWTLAYEFTCYVIVAALGACGLLRKRWFIALLFVVSLLPLPLQSLHQNIQILVMLFSYFSAGMLAYLYFPDIKFSAKYIALACAALATSLFTPYFQTAFAVFGSYLILKLAFLKVPALQAVTRNGDFSYGIYIYAFPLQQFIVQRWGTPLSWLQLFAISYLVTLIFAMLSWHFIEKPALQLKRAFPARPT